MKLNPATACDFYKVAHAGMYPDGTELVYSNFTCRSDRLADVLPDFDHRIVWFGLQGVCQWLLRDAWNDGFFKRPKEEVVGRWQRRMDASLGVGAVSSDRIAALHDLGYLPILIKGLPEGSRVNMKVPLFTIQNTKPEFFWITNYLETQLSATIWKSLTSATTAYEYRRLIDRYASMTGVPKSFAAFGGHDFSMRGQAGIHDAASSGAGHLLSFMGTDTISAIDYLEDYYRGAETFVGASVPASEHSCICMGGSENELETIRRLITKVHPSGIVSIVADSWSYYRVITEFAEALKPEILTRKPDALGNARVVFRPDSGVPLNIICGDPSAPEGSPERKGSVRLLWELFGGTITETGHRVLDSHVGLIYGDSITLNVAHDILNNLYEQGFASSNIIFGVGSFTYQRVTRDSYGTAMKATFGVVNGEDRNIFKNPATDSGIKKSAVGLLRVEKEGNDFVLYERQSRTQEGEGMLKPIFWNGNCVSIESLAEIRARLHPEW